MAWSDAARAAALEVRRRNAVSKNAGRKLKRGDSALMSDRFGKVKRTVLRATPHYNASGQLSGWTDTPTVGENQSQMARLLKRSSRLRVRVARSQQIGPHAGGSFMNGGAFAKQPNSMAGIKSQIAQEGHAARAERDEAARKVLLKKIGRKKFNKIYRRRS